MVLQDDMLAELKPSIHRIIKKQLGFSEETLLSESLTSLQHGADKDELTRKFLFTSSFFGGYSRETITEFFHNRLICLLINKLKCVDFDYRVLLLLKSEILMHVEA